MFTVEKAFESMDRAFMLVALSAYKIPTKLLSICNEFYRDCSTREMHSENDGDPFPIKSGVKHGSVLSVDQQHLGLSWPST